MWKAKIKKSLKQTYTMIKSGDLIILTESDLKTALANELRKSSVANITINTESPWYDTYITKKSYHIDITAFNSDKLQITYDPSTKRKGYRYDAEALAVELKYFRYTSDISEIKGDYKKMSLLINAPKNECYIIAGARTEELFNEAEILMKTQMNEYRDQYRKLVKVYLFGPTKLKEII